MYSVFRDFTYEIMYKMYKKYYPKYNLVNKYIKKCVLYLFLKSLVENDTKIKKISETL